MRSAFVVDCLPRCTDRVYLVITDVKDYISHSESLWSSEGASSSLELSTLPSQTPVSSPSQSLSMMSSPTSQRLISSSSGLAIVLVSLSASINVSKVNRASSRRQRARRRRSILTLLTCIIRTTLLVFCIIRTTALLAFVSLGILSDEMVQNLKRDASLIVAPEPLRRVSVQLVSTNTSCIPKCPSVCIRIVPMHSKSQIWGPQTPGSLLRLGFGSRSAGPFS